MPFIDSSFPITSYLKHFTIKLFWLLLVLFSAMPFAVQGNPAKNANLSADNGFGITQSQLKVKIEALKNNKEIDETAKPQILNLYLASQENLASIEAYTLKVQGFEDDLRQAPEKIKKLQQDIEQNQQKNNKQKTEDFTKISDLELEQRLIFEKNKGTDLNDQLGKLDKALAEQNIRPGSIREEITAARQNLETAQKKLENSNNISTSKLESEARQLYQETLIDLYTTELKKLAAEASSNQARVELLKTQLQWLNLQKSLQDPIIEMLESLVNNRRQQAAIHIQQELSEAERSITDKPKVIQQTTRENIAYSRDLQTVAGKIKTYNDFKNRLDAVTKEIDSDFKSAEKKINLAGLSPVLGKILRKQRRNLSIQEQALIESDNVQKEIAQASLILFQIEDNLKALADLDNYLKDTISESVSSKIPADERMMIQAELRVLLNTQVELLNKLSSTYGAYLRTLGDFDFAKQQMLAESGKFAKYLDERLLWVPSSEPINAAYFTELYKAFGWFLSPRNWLGLLKNTVTIAWQNLFLTFLTIFISALLPMVWRWAKRELIKIAEKVEKIYTDDFNYTLKALAYTLILALPLPIICYYFGWFLSIDAHVTDFSRVIGQGLQSAAIPLFVLQFLYRLFAANGIAVRHFQWQQRNAQLIHKQTGWLRYAVVSGMFIIGSTSASNSGNYNDSLGRLALIILLIALAVFFAKLMSPTTGLLQDYLKKHPDEWLAKLRYLWYPLLISSPLIVVGFAVAGYYLSALELEQKLVTTVRLIFVIVIIHALVMRWLTLVNRKLALKNARQKRKAAALSEKQSASEDVVSGDDPALPIDEQLIDIPTTNAQTIKLLIGMIGFFVIVGIWMIWSNILPAFSFLDRIVLWQHVVSQDDQQILQPVTLTNLIMAGLYVFIIVVSVRNFPGVMELLLFSRLSIAAGGRYAVNQLAKYLIIAIGFICVANELGGSWSQVQWLVAALSVGLGFGLQEIFANLVSGIILLFERPIRVGDTVTISNVTGKVSRIQMRATTVLDFDQKELIVPNKTFITNQFVNWTLTDSITRVVIPITISEGSDVELAHKVMVDAVRATPLVLDEPSPSVVFTGFSDKGLEFSIRVFVNELANRLPVTHNLLVNLDKMLHDHHIDMSFTQKSANKSVETLSK